MSPFSLAIWLLPLCRGEDFRVQAMVNAAVGQELDCVNSSTAEQWREGFAAAVETMMQRSKRTMQLGLTSLAQGVLLLAERCEMPLLQGQALRLKVLASTRSLAGLDATVKYEPLKALTVGGIDVHRELNDLLVAWQMKRGEEELGRSLALFLADFADDASEAPEAPEPVAEPRPGTLQRTKAFWLALLTAALGLSEEQLRLCVPETLAQLNADKFDEAFGRMMQKTQRSMQHGLKILALATAAKLGSDSLHLLEVYKTFIPTYYRYYMKPIRPAGPIQGL